MNQGVKLNLEMQNRSQYDWSERSIFYNCRMFTDGFLHGMDYGQLEPCIHVGILDFKQLESRGFHHNILLMDKASHEIYSSKFLFHVIELSKLQDATEEEKSRELYQWAVMLAAERWEDICMTVQGNPYREAARDELEKIRQNEIERWIYLREEMAISDERSRLKTAELQGIEQGLKQGRAEGLAKGREQGLASTVQMLQNTGHSKEEIVQNLLKYYALSLETAEKAVADYWLE
jgi:predicted transposase/invertase (TIGR01784 family)